MPIDKNITWLATKKQSLGHGIGLKVNGLIVAFIENFE